MKKTRTRFAPSPTGYMHIGNLRTALYEYLIAKSQGGDFLLRIEDTDQERYVEGALDVVFNTLKATGIDYDEGPGKEGDCGPYIQSQRRDIYKKYAEILVEKGAAYYCFCTKERLESLKTSDEALGTGFNYDRHCRDLDPEVVAMNLAAGIPYVIRQKMPLTGTTTFTDAVYGDITVENKTLDDQVLLKSDGLPTYNFANVVDDHLMGITHVVRGNEYLSSTPKYNLLYEAFGWDIPVYVHCAPIMKDEHHKLSKRNGDASFFDLVAKGYLPEAILNYICLLGWSPSGNEEFYTLGELEKVFSISGISKSPAIFDIEKLTWMNGEYIKRMDDDRFLGLTLGTVEDVFKNAGAAVPAPEVLKKIALLVKTRVSTLAEIPEKIGFLAALQDYDTELYCHKKMKTDREISLKALGIIEKAFGDSPEVKENFVSDKIYEFLLGVAAENELKNSQLLWPLRTAVSGLPATPGGATELAEILGYDETMRRIADGIARLS